MGELIDMRAFFEIERECRGGQGMKYRKKPVVIEAVRWTGGNDSLQAISALGGGTLELADGRGLEILTLEGTMTARIGDWIIRGIKGELYPCKPDIFAATYDPVEVTYAPLEEDY